MTTYTMNGHSHAVTETPIRDLTGVPTAPTTQPRPARLRSKALPEKFNCLDSPEPRAQLQAALKQIEALLQENAALRDTVLLLSQSLNAPHALIHKDDSAGRSNRVRLRLLHDFYGCMEQLR